MIMWHCGVELDRLRPFHLFYFVAEEILQLMRVMMVMRMRREERVSGSPWQECGSLSLSTCLPPICAANTHTSKLLLGKIDPAPSQLSNQKFLFRYGRVERAPTITSIDEFTEKKKKLTNQIDSGH